MDRRDEMSDADKAVFLSYAKQDAEAAARIADALRAAGVEVWFDQSELRGGDAWDAKIRKQIKECALFLPIISANTQARTEGYFRLEWRLADQRTHLMAKGRAFLLPIVIDATRDAEAHVPDSFLDVQWSRVTTDVAAASVAARVRGLLANEPAVAGERRESVGGPAPAALPQAKRSFRVAGIGVGATLLVVIAAIALWPRSARVANSTPVASASPALGTPAAELAAVRARIVPDRWQKEDFETVSSTLDRIIAANPEMSDAWALRSIINTLQVTRNYESGAAPLAAGQNAADRAVRLAPGSPLAELALGFHQMAMVTRGGDPQAGRAYLDRALKALPPDAITRYIELVSVWQCYDLRRTEESANAWLAAEPEASLPAWLMAQMNVVLRRPDEVEKWAERAATDRNVTGIRAYYSIFEAKYYLRADIAAARAALDRVPPSGRLVHRVVHGQWLVAMAERRWDDALQILAHLTDPFLFDRTYHGPRALLAGLAHQRAGRADAANIQFREAERQLRERLNTDTENDELHSALAVTLACLGRAADARSELALVEPLLVGRVPSIYRGPQTVIVAQARAILGDTERLNFWLRKLLAEQSGLPFTPASLRLDPRFADRLEAPETQALLREFAQLDQSAPLVTKADEKSVAVLAFADLSAAHDNEYFSDGISEELLNVLAKVPGLKVTARTSAFFFKGQREPIPEIARKLGVAYVVEGSVQRAGDRVKITAQLIKAADGFHVWSEAFTRDAKDVFAVEDEIAGLIAQQLSLKLGATSAAATTNVKPEAFDRYVEARAAWNLRTAEGFDRAEQLLRRVLELEPKFAGAHAALADVWMLRETVARRLRQFGQRDAASVHRTEAEIRRALELDPNSSEAHTSLGYLRAAQWRLSDAESEYRRALAVNPNYATAHQWLAWALFAEGWIDEGLAEAKHAAELDPFSSRILDNYAQSLVYAGRATEGLAIAERAIQVQPSNQQALVMKALALARLEHREEAVAIARDVAEELFRAIIFSAAGAKPEIEAELPKLARGSTARFDLLVALGRGSEGLGELRADEVIAVQPATWALLADYDAVRYDPRLRTLLEALGATEAYDRARAWRAAHPLPK